MKKTQTQRLKFLDALRGIAACLVSCMHFQTLLYEHSTARLPILLDTLFKDGHAGVNIFFVLSGFVIAYSIRLQRFSFTYIGLFFLRRSLRLDPPYWVSLFGFTALIALGSLLFNRGGEYVPTLREFLLNAFYLQNLFQAKNILPVAWTLCLEIQFYLIFTLMVKWVQDINSRFHLSLFHFGSAASLILFGSLFILSLIQAMPHSFTPITPGLFLPYWHSFFIGCLICWSWLGLIKETWAWIGCLLIGACALISREADLGITLGVALTIFWCSKKEMLQSALDYPLLQYLGRVSYSLYLIHWVVGIKSISFLSYTLGSYFDTIPAWGVIGLSFSITIGATELFYRFVEKPALNLSKKLFYSIPSSELKTV